MVVITKDYFSIRQICESGQCFRLEELGKEEDTDKKSESTGTGTGSDAVREPISPMDGELYRYGLTALGRYLEIEQKENEIKFDCTQE